MWHEFGALSLVKQVCGKVWFSQTRSLNSNGHIISYSQHNYLWMKYSVLLGNNLSLEEVTCDIELLLSNASFPTLLNTLET